MLSLDDFVLVHSTNNIAACNHYASSSEYSKVFRHYKYGHDFSNCMSFGILVCTYYTKTMISRYYEQGGAFVNRLSARTCCRICISYWNGFSPVCMNTEMCLRSHMFQWNGFSPPWTRMCFLITFTLLRMNFWSHNYIDWNGLSPLWTQM